MSEQETGGLRAVCWRTEAERRSATYRSVPIEVVRWRSLNADGTAYTDPHIFDWTWNYYLYLALDALPERLHAGFNRPPEWLGASPRPYYRAPAILTGLHWHGDITLFEKDGGADGTPVTFRVGCDYAHGFDRHRSYTMDDVVRDACRTVDDLWEAIPDMRIRCDYNGQWTQQQDGFWARTGGFTSFDGARSEYEWHQRRKAEAAETLERR